jgi:hypothetical protein
VFEERRHARPDEIAALLRSFDVIEPPDVLREATISAVTLDELRAAHTVIAVTQPLPGHEHFHTLAECEASWASGGGSVHDQESYQRALLQAEDPAFAPEILFEPTTLTSSRWWIVDAIHRGAALLTKGREPARAAGAARVRVYVLPRPLS